MTETTFSLVSPRAAIQRINRRLAPQWEKLVTARGVYVEQELGRYYVIDLYRNFVVSQDVDLDSLARELKCLESWEKVAEE